LAEAQAEAQAAKEAEQRRQTLQEALAEAKETREAAEVRGAMGPWGHGLGHGGILELVFFRKFSEEFEWNGTFDW
jgi:hypothetical protein